MNSQNSNRMLPTYISEILTQSRKIQSVDVTRSAAASWSRRAILERS